jgi:hypothetical protein
MKKTTFVGAACLVAAMALIGGCASNESGTVAQNGQKASCCGDKASAEAKTCTGEAKASTCTGEAKASGCCGDKTGAAAVAK